MIDIPNIQRNFVDDGYVIIRDVVDRELVERIANRTNDEFEHWKANMFPTETNSGGIFLPQWEEHALILECIEAKGIVTALHGEVGRWFPTVIFLDPQEKKEWPLGEMHIDRPPTTNPDHQWPTFGLSIGVGIVGGDIPNSGGLGVFPGTHRLCEEYFRRHTDKNLWNLLTGEHRAVSGRPKVELPFVRDSPLVEVLLEPGDIVCSHSLLTHTSMPNLTRKRRIASYFAFIHSEHATIGNEFVRSIWHYWPEEIQEYAKQYENSL